MNTHTHHSFKPIVLFILSAFVFFPTPNPQHLHAQETLPLNEIPVGVVIVTDNLNSSENLIGGYDQDDFNDRNLVLQWSFGNSVLLDVHIYLQSIENKQNIYLGRTGNGNATTFQWKPGSLLTSIKYREGPQFGEIYRFIIIGLQGKQTGRVHI